MADRSQSRVQRRKRKKVEKNKKLPNLNWKKVLLIFSIISALLFTGVTGLFLYYVQGAPSLKGANISDPLSAKIYDRNGEIIADLGAEKRTKIEYSDIPKILEDAVIATEDARFYDHIGIDFRRIGGAVLANITDGFGAQGASTITQQVVKNAFLNRKKTIERKVQEQWLAIKLEQKYSKHEILTMYLNKIYYGNSAYGVAKAAEIYFGKQDLDDLTLAEAALLAGLPQLPSAYDPFDYPERAEKRKDIVLDLMVHHEKITQEEADEAKEINVEDLLVEDYKTSVPYEDFIERVIYEVQERLGEEVNIYTDGLEIHTTIDPNAQQYVETLLSGEESPIEYPDDKLQTGVTVLNTQTGEILAIGGNRENNKGIGGNFNYAFNQSGRQPGSTMKPILDYGPAIEHLKYSTYQQIKDEKHEYTNGTPIRNWNDEYQGWNTARYHLKESLNIPALKTFQDVGAELAGQFMEGLGIPIPDKGLHESDSIGGGNVHVTPLEMAGAYAAFGNEGLYHKPYAVTKVVVGGETIDFKPEPTVAMSDYTAYMMTDMLKSVVTSGTGTAANVPGIPVAGKTGTTNYEDKTPDAWFTGYSTNFTISVWTGYDEYPSDIPYKGQQIPKAMFKHIMTHLSNGVETTDFVKPDSVVRVGVEKGSNPAKLPSDYTPENEIVYELFVKGHEPTEVSEQYDRVDPVYDVEVEYDDNKEVIDVKWKHDSQDDNISFDIQAGEKGQDSSVNATTDKKQATIRNVEQGRTYVISLIAFDKHNENRRSEAYTVEVEIPEKDENPLDDFFEDDEESEEEDQNGNHDSDDESTEEEPTNEDETDETDDSSDENDDSAENPIGDITSLR
ncbi:transglycosylase domain-containing protein [Salirhabdus salicampi]|uniref:transglycosylase domain-containing protein n=1 Tax=Salirhabdus salicampi TaxID=476102 RepID=UPI0020C5595E|nr:PBP1A family penicillin-binding protein [Salirhabdus salicampi]MCP8616664.1 PBP1A family penicillin-binding protein [Salirhabdus salicampi]